VKEAKTPPKQQRIGIGELARRASVTPRTVRYYEQLGLIDKASREPYVKRAYDPRDVYSLRVIQRAKLLGLSLAEIKEISDIFRQDPTETRGVQRSIEVLTSHLHKLKTQMQEMEAAYATVSKEIERLKNLLHERSSSGIEPSKEKAADRRSIIKTNTADRICNSD
jgi:DNA-binding transcriptional MerR regulator